MWGLVLVRGGKFETMNNETIFWIQQYINQKRYLEQLPRPWDVDLSLSAQSQFMYFITKAHAIRESKEEEGWYFVTFGVTMICLSAAMTEAMNDLDFYILDNPDKFK